MNRKIYQWALISVCSVLAACSAKKPQPVVYLEKPAISAQWMSNKEALLLESIKGSPFTLHKQDNAWVVTAPAHQAFNADRPNLLMPAMLRTITRIAKILEASPDTSVLILGHSDRANDDSAGRAGAVALIFRLSGLKRDRMMHLGMGSSFMLEQRKSALKNHRVEIIITQHAQMQDVMATYHPVYVRQLALTQAR